MKQIVFLSGTRADYGKIKPLISILKGDSNYRVTIIVTGMHLLQKYGTTLHEIENDKLADIVILPNQQVEQAMEISLAKTIEELSIWFTSNEVDLLVVHGDRVEALAGAIVGAIRNIPVAHIEGGEVSGTIDGLIRHSVSKLSHVHFVSNGIAQSRLIQIGESLESVHVVGSPDVDVMLGSNLPVLEQIQSRYSIPFENYGIVIFHPVTTEYIHLEKQIDELAEALLSSTWNYVIIKPNNDLGSEIIQNRLRKLNDKSRFIHIPSMRFEYFLGLLRDAKFIIGNSSAGIREAPYYGVPSINIGSRQRNRASNPLVLDVSPERNQISLAIAASQIVERTPHHQFGAGNSALKFKEILDSVSFWPITIDKIFVDQ